MAWPKGNPIAIQNQNHSIGEMPCVLRVITSRRVHRAAKKPTQWMIQIKRRIELMVRLSRPVHFQRKENSQIHIEMDIWRWGFAERKSNKKKRKRSNHSREVKTSQPTKTITQRRDFGRFPLRPAPLLHKTCLLLRPLSARFSNSLCSFVLLCCFVFPRIGHQLWGFWAILNQHCCVTLSCIPPVLCYKSHITLCVLVYRQKCKYLFPLGLQEGPVGCY